ncbi:MAG: FAD-dependent oxidoreductase [Candidatus Paceibacterota bacterium]|jgi:alkyl hydroperoxide reductase subunit F
MFDLIIIGGGPAACSAGVYAARKKLKTLVIAQELGGQSTVAPEIQNWLGEISISGDELSKKFVNHLRSYEGETLTIKTGVASDVKKETDNFVVATQAGESFQTKTVLLAMGGSRRKLSTKGADIFEHKGLTYCASCDGPLFSGQDVAVIGGGNAGFGTAGQLLAYCKSVTLLEMMPTFRAEAVTIENLKQNPNFKAISNVELIEIKGDKFVSSLVYKNKDNSELVELPVTGIFVEIGFLPNTEMVKELVNLNPAGNVIVDHQTQRSSLNGLWAAGDCSDVKYHQNGIAAGDAVKATEDIYEYLQGK